MSGEKRTSEQTTGSREAGPQRQRFCPQLHSMVAAFTATLPNSRTRAVWVLALFVVVQVADAMLTLGGVERFGPAAEGNPLLAFYIITCGVGVTLVAAKALAISLSIVLHVRAQHLALAALLVVYVLAALTPWALINPL